MGSRTVSNSNAPTDPEVLTAIAEMRVEITNMSNQLDDLKDELDKKYVTKAQFEPIRLIIYSLVGAGLFTLINTILTNAGLVP